MLVLTRKRNQSIMIGDEIEIVIVDVKNEQVKIGIKAPRNVTVHRKEIYEEIQEENRLAAKPVVGSLDDLNRLLGKQGKKN
ncbi:MAG: carbon storage regulator CsrA [Candidatus Wallbacteria bacterium]|nr:carbon storage regulator CsrA [Candidatus Wallbacteria bacterium]